MLDIFKDTQRECFPCCYGESNISLPTSKLGRLAVYVI